MTGSSRRTSVGVACAVALFDAGWREIGFQVVFTAGLAMFVAGPAFTQVVASFGAVRAAMLTAATLG